MAKALEGVGMELDDCAFELVTQITLTTDAAVAFQGIDFCIMVGAFPRKQGMLRKDLLEKNANIFETQGKILDHISKVNVLRGSFQPQGKS